MKIGFSSEVVDLNNQVPNRNRRECKYYWDELYTLISAAGFKYMELSYQPKWDFGCRSCIPLTNRSVMMKYKNYDNYSKKLNESGLDGVCAVHFNPSMFCGGNIDMYFGAFEHFAMEALEYTSGLKSDVLSISATPTYYNVKTCCPAGISFDEFEKTFLERTAETVNRIAEKAAEKGVVICLRNDYWTLLRGEKIVDFVKKFNGKVFIDADTASLKIAGTDPEQFIKDNLDIIKIVHFTDTSFTDDQEAYLQALPEFPAKAATKVFKDIGQGSIDFARISDILKDGGYDGNIVYNCKDSYQPSRALLRTRYYIQSKICK